MSAPTDLRTAHLGNGSAIHLVDDQGILCNRWGTVNGVWKAPRFVAAQPTCKRCQKLAPADSQLLQAICQDCGQLHEATYSHEGEWGQGPIYAVVCTMDGLTGYYTAEGLAS